MGIIPFPSLSSSPHTRGPPTVATPFASDEQPKKSPFFTRKLSWPALSSSPVAPAVEEEQKEVRGRKQGWVGRRMSSVRWPIAKGARRKQEEDESEIELSQVGKAASEEQKEETSEEPKRAQKKGGEGKRDSLTAIQNKLKAAKESEKAADLALKTSRLAVREARNSIDLLEREAIVEAEEALKRLRGIQDIKKEGEKLGRHE
ncbi:hypothetical protein BCR35DRAFT_333926 [Leucosporidium creatinivorum]|uniref:Uncharacterized protein n=1 Tax=Leucosporidium creatinivorum TaxID=106004 RepID=A0A1Y2EMF5_9BASI|nr:hypothetical protein BCR35DRAFT_333926 [Leucosporidium creatinivorum]